MNLLFQPMLANGMAILVTVAYVWIATTTLSSALAVIALLLAILRKAVRTTRILGGIACGIGLVPIPLALWVVLGPGTRRPLSLYQFAAIILSFIPGLVASAALILSFRRPPPPTAPSISLP